MDSNFIIKSVTLKAHKPAVTQNFSLFQDHFHLGSPCYGHIKLHVHTAYNTVIKNSMIV